MYYLRTKPLKHKLLYEMFVYYRFYFDGLLLPTEVGSFEVHIKKAKTLILCRETSAMVMAVFFGEVLSVNFQAVEEDVEDIDENEEDLKRTRGKEL